MFFQVIGAGFGGIVFVEIDANRRELLDGIRIGGVEREQFFCVFDGLVAIMIFQMSFDKLLERPADLSVFAIGVLFVDLDFPHKFCPPMIFVHCSIRSSAKFAIDRSNVAELGQCGEILHGALRLRQSFAQSLDVRVRQYFDQNSMRRTCKCRILSPALNIKSCITFRVRRIVEPIIALREISVNPFRLFGCLQFLQQHPQIAFRLLAIDAARIAGVDDLNDLIGHGQNFIDGLIVRRPKFLMNAPDVMQPALENPTEESRIEQRIIFIDVDVDEFYQQRAQSTLDGELD